VKCGSIISAGELAIMAMSAYTTMTKKGGEMKQAEPLHLELRD
jgi:hypothetical protein